MDRVDFESKVDRWLILVLLSSAASCLVAAVLLMMEGTPANWVIALLTIALGVAMPIWLLRSTRYAFDTDELKIQCGMMRWTIPIADIQSVKPTHSLLSGPALSLDRLRIDHRRGSVLISPRDPKAFLDELDRRQKATPNRSDRSD